MKKLSIWLYSLIVAVLYYLLFPKTQSYLYSKESFEYIASIINPEPGGQLFIFGVSINIIHDAISGVIAGLISSIVLLSRLDNYWKVYGISSLVIYLIFRYFMLIVRFDQYIVNQEIGKQVVHYISPIIAGLALIFAQWILSRLRRRLPMPN